MTHVSRTKTNNNITRLAYVSDARCVNHINNHVEIQNRWTVLDKHLSTLPKKSWTHLHNEETGSLQDTVSEAVARVHTPQYIHKVKEACINEKSLCTDDVQTGRLTLEAAFSAVASVLTALKYIFSTDNTSSSASSDNSTASSSASSSSSNSTVSARSNGSFVFCNNRPPGHHASSNRAAGFCVFNTAVIASISAVRLYPTECRKVAIFDYDVHAPCDGSMEILKKYDKQWNGCVSLYSIHQSDLFPNTRSSNTNVDKYPHIYNRCLPANCSLEDYMSVFESLLDIMKQEGNKPDLIVISCGFDSCVLDPIGSFPLKVTTYKTLTTKLLEVCPRVLSTLEGGYNLDVLPSCLAAHLSGASDFMQKFHTK
jgi:acetoin utilization deacetylase AcuC-like enzyme